MLRSWKNIYIRLDLRFHFQPTAWHAPHFQLTAWRVRGRAWWTSTGNRLQEGRREPGTCWTRYDNLGTCWTRYDNLLVCQLVCCCCNRVTASLLLTCCCLFSQSSCCSFILLHSRKLYGWMESFNGWCCKLCIMVMDSWSWWLNKNSSSVVDQSIDYILHR